VKRKLFIKYLKHLLSFAICMRKCLNIRYVHSTMYGMAYTNWFVRRYSWLIISMHRVCRQMAHIMFFNSFVWCVWWVLGSELEAMFGHLEKFLSPNTHRLIWYYCEDVIIYLDRHSGWASDCDPRVPCSIPVASISLISETSMLTYLSAQHTDL
jgi:hypothetical protein